MTIARPVNDRQCLGQLLDVAGEMRNSQTARNLAAEFTTPADVAHWLRGLPQRNDDGNAWGPESVACDTRQRLRNWPDDPNCFERTAMFVAVADRLEPGEPWSAATVETRNGGRHTVPVLLGGRRPLTVDLNPRDPSRNGAKRMRNGGGMAFGIFDQAPRNSSDDSTDAVPVDAVVSARFLLGGTDGFLTWGHDRALGGDERYGNSWMFVTGPYQGGWTFVAFPPDDDRGTFLGLGDLTSTRTQFVHGLRYYGSVYDVSFFGRPGSSYEQKEVSQRGRLVPRNADPWVQDVFGVVHGGGRVVLGVFGAGAAGDELEKVERKEGLLKDNRKTPASTPEQQESDTWPRRESSTGNPPSWGLF